MRVTFKQNALIIAILLSLACFCGSINEARAQTLARYNLLLSSQANNLGQYYLMLHWNLKNNGYSDTSGYDLAGLASFEVASMYAQTATQYALQDYNNNVQSTYYKAYMEYVTLNTMQSYYSTGLYYADLASDDSLSNATAYQYTKLAIDNLHNAVTFIGPGIFWAGCEP